MLELTPLTLKEARVFVDRHHRHHRSPQGGLFAVGVALAGRVVGVAIVGRPVARHLATGYTAEVTRLCVLEGTPNAASKLYGLLAGGAGAGIPEACFLHPSCRTRHQPAGGWVAVCWRSGRGELGPCGATKS